jgi:hypothetical protein
MGKKQEQEKASLNRYEKPKAYMSLVSYCNDNGMTIQDFCDEHGFCPCAISRWGSRKRRPSLRKAVALEKATGGAVQARDWAE